MKPVVWLASYPKSGNTWLRFQLAHYYSDRLGKHIALNELRFGRLNALRPVLDEWLAFDSSDLEPDETDSCRAEANLRIAASAHTRVFFKVHDAYTMTPSGQRLFASDTTHAIVYIVRHPFDVALSLAHHFDYPVDRAVAFLCSHDSQLGGQPGGITPQVSQKLFNWSQHVNSWLDEPGLAPLLVRYEDMLTDPAGQLSRVVEHLDGHVLQPRVRAAVDFSRFDRLQDEERKLGFKERRSKRSAFFRVGHAGQWMAELNSIQTEKLITAHRTSMGRLGYLDADGNPTTGQSRSERVDR